MRALTHPSRHQVVVAVLLAVVGFAAMTQVQAQSDDDAYAGYREQDLIDVLNGLTDTTQRAQREITRLEQAKADLQSSSEARQAALIEARKQADTLDILAGTVPVTGPGIRVTIDETDGAVSTDSLLDMIQELRGAGAEAMQFNGQVRVVASTSFEDGVGGIYVDDQPARAALRARRDRGADHAPRRHGLPRGTDRAARGRRGHGHRGRAAVARHQERGHPGGHAVPPARGTAVA